MQVPTQKAVNDNPYAAIWSEKVSQNGWLFLPLIGIYKAFMYLVCARFVVTGTNWLHSIMESIKEAVINLVHAAGKGAESLFVICTFYILCYTVARPLLNKWPGTDMVGNLNHFVLIVFCGLPELILLDAITLSVDRCVKFAHLFQVKKGHKAACTWAILTSIPTLFFIVLTVFTLSAYVGSSNNNFDMIQLTGFALLFRVLPGWCYAIVNGLYAKFGGSQYTNVIASFKEDLLARTKIIEQRDETVHTLIEANDSLHTEIDSLQAQLHLVAHELQELKNRKQARKATTIRPETKEVPEGTNEQEKDSLPNPSALSEPVTGSESSQSSNNGYSVSEVEASELLGVPLRTISRLVNSDALKHAPNSTRITVSSIEKHAQRKGIELKRGAQSKQNGNVDESTNHETNTESIPVHKEEVSNGHVKQTISLDEYPQILV